MPDPTHCIKCGAPVPYSGTGRKSRYCDEHNPAKGRYGKCKGCGQPMKQGHTYPHYCSQECYLNAFRIYRPAWARSRFEGVLEHA